MQVASSSYCINETSLSYNNIISHNILSASYDNYSNHPNNKYNQLTNSIFTLDYYDEYSKRDTNYVLSENSPAKGYAEDGGDCGPFSGAYPYVMSGFPLYVPRFESVNVPSSPTNGKLRVTLTVKNQNE